MLTACHERVERMLSLLDRLCAHLTSKGWDQSAAQAASDVMRYFDLAAPHHHLDEERHVFPAVLASPDTDGLHAVVTQLQQDHEVMEQRWAQARQVLQRVDQLGDAPWTPLTPEERAVLKAFSDLYERHIQLEEQHIYPAAKALFDTDDIRAMGQEMHYRRVERT
jgi:hemerythrin-like domain-containing protein